MTIIIANWWNSWYYYYFTISRRSLKQSLWYPEVAHLKTNNFNGNGAIVSVYRRCRAENIFYMNHWWVRTKFKQESYMVPAAKEMLLSRTFPGQNYHFPGQSIQDLKVINWDTREKAYHICSMYDQLLKFLWYSLLLAPSICLIHPLLFKF